MISTVTLVNNDTIMRDTVTIFCFDALSEFVTSGVTFHVAQVSHERRIFILKALTPILSGLWQTCLNHSMTDDERYQYRPYKSTDCVYIYVNSKIYINIVCKSIYENCTVIVILVGEVSVAYQTTN